MAEFLEKKTFKCGKLLFFFGFFFNCKRKTEVCAGVVAGFFQFLSFKHNCRLQNQ